MVQTHLVPLRGRQQAGPEGKFVYRSHRQLGTNARKEKPNAVARAPEVTCGFLSLFSIKDCEKRMGEWRDPKIHANEGKGMTWP